MTSEPAILKQTNKLALAGFVASRVQIQTIFQHSAHYHRIPDVSEGPETLEMTTHVDTQSLKEANQICATVHCGVRAETKSHKEYIKIEAIFIAIYSVINTEAITEDHINAFGDINGVYNVWPYWREFVQSTTARMGLSALTLPVHRPTDGTTPDKHMEQQHPSQPVPAPKAVPKRGSRRISS